MTQENISENEKTPEPGEKKSSGSVQKRPVSMAVKVNESTADTFRRMARETGMEQGMFLDALLENFRLNEDKVLYKEYAEDIQSMQDLTAAINYN